MTIIRSYLDGLRRVVRAPLVWCSAWLITLLLAVPLALLLRDMIAVHLGPSLAAASAAEGVNWEWWQEFQQQTTGLGKTFGPSVLGFASVLKHVSDLLDGAPLTPALAGLVGTWLVVWSFLSGGILDRYARDRATWASGFFAACGTHFFRFVRLGVLALPVYYALFAWVHAWLLDDLLGQLTRTLSEERTAFALTALVYSLFGLVLVGTTLVFDYARVRIIVEDRRSAIGALAAGGRFVRRHVWAVTGLFAVNAAGFLALAALYALVAPGAGGSGLSQWTGLAIAQAWIAARIGVKLTFYASAISLFQRMLAHAEYVATTVADWPESPAAEAIRGESPTATLP
jgi:hypothetical protein